MAFLPGLRALFSVEPKTSEAESASSFEITISIEGYDSPPRREPVKPRRALAESSRDVLLGEFAIVDVETTGLNAECDDIIEIAAIHVGPGFQLVSEFRTLVKTDAWIPHNIVEMTGITQADVDSHGISLAEAMALFVGHVAQRPVFAHNAQFDYGFLEQAADQCGVAFDNPMHDSIQIAREAWPGLRSYKLSVLVEQLDLDYAPTHRALDDVKATLALLRAAHETLNGERPRTPPPEAFAWRAFPRHVAREGNTDGPLHGEFVVFTGELSLTREQAADHAARAGCTVTPSVTKKTTLLVVGTQDLATLAGHEKSSKHRKAEELLAKGQHIRILTESDFLELVGA